MPSRRSHTVLALVGLLVVGALLRVRGIDRQSFWHDEFIALQNSTGRGMQYSHLPFGVVFEAPPSLTSLELALPPQVIWSSLGEDTHPPLFFIALRLWREWVGDGEAAVRALPVLLSLVAIALLFAVARRLHGEPVALWAALLMAVSSTQIHYAQEARNYTMLHVASLAACLALVRMSKDGPRVWNVAGVFLGLLGMALTHYFFIGAAAAMAIYALLRMSGRARRAALLAFAAAGVVYLLMWGPFLLEQRSTVEPGYLWLRETRDLHWPRTLARSLLVPLRLVVDRAAGWPTVLYTVGVVSLVASGRWRRRSDSLLWIVWLAGVVGLVAVLDLLRDTRQLSWIRYTLLASPAVFVLVGVVLTDGEGRLIRVARWVVLGFCLVTLPRAYAITKPDWRGCAAFLERESRPGDLFVLSSMDRPDWVSRTFYLGLSHYEDFVGRFVLLTDALDPTSARETLSRGGRVWLLANPRNPGAVHLTGFALTGVAHYPELGTIWRLQLAPEPRR